MHRKDATSEPVGTGVCNGCSAHAELFITDAGLRCDDCRPVSPSQQPTYTPSLRGGNESAEREKEMMANIESFEEQLPEITFDVELQDGSTYSMDQMYTQAVLLSHGEDWEHYLAELASEVATHFEKQTEPARYGTVTEWGCSEHDDSQSEYDSHAELAPVVAYAHLRGAILQLGLQALSGEDDSSPTVVGLGDDMLHKYSEEGRISVPYEDLEDASSSDFGGDSE